MNAKAAIKRLNPFIKREFLLFILFFSCYIYFFPRRADWGQNARLDEVLAIVDEQTLSIDSYQFNTKDVAFYNGHYYSVKAPGTTFLSIPAYAAFKVSLKIPPLNRLLMSLSYYDPSHRSPDHWSQIPIAESYFASALYFVTVFTGALPSAILGVVFYRLLGRFSSRSSHKLGLTLAYGLATIAFPYSGAFYGHQLAATFAFTAFYLLSSQERRPDAKKASWVGLLLGLTVLTEYPTVLIAAILFVYAVYRLRDPLRIVWILAGGLPPLALLMSYSCAIYGTVLPVSYLYAPHFHKVHHTGLMGITYPRLDALYGITFSPYRGLFFLSPFLLLAIPGFYYFLRERGYRSEALTALAVVLSFFWYNASLFGWADGWAVGPRYLVPMLPFMAFPIIFFLKDRLRRQVPDKKVRWKEILFLSLVAGSFLLVWAETVGGESFPPVYSYHPLTDFALPNYLQGQLARNLGMVIGLPAWFSLLPLLVLLGVGIWFLWKEGASEEKGIVGALEVFKCQRLSWGQAACLIGIGLYVVLIFVLQTRLYLGLHMGICDLGLFDQAMYNSLHGRFLNTSIYCQEELPVSSPTEGRMLLSEHLYLIMPLLFPIYALFPHPYTLFFLQAFATGMGALAVFLIAKDRLRSELAAACFCLSYLLYPTLQGAALNHFSFGFRPDNFFPALFLFSFYSSQKKRFGLFWFLNFAALTVAEYYALPLAALGLFLALTDRERRKVGIILLLVCVLWFAIATWLVLPYFQSGDPLQHISAPEEGNALFDKPGVGPKLAVTLGSYLLCLLAPVAFLPLAALPTFAIAIPNILVNLIAFVSGNPLATDPNSWHAAPIIPIVFVSAIWGLGNVVNRVERPWQIKLLRVLSTISVAMALFSNYWLGPLPFSRSVDTIQYSVNKAKAERVEEIKNLFPKDATLAVEFFSGSNFAQRQTLYWFPHHWREADYVLVDASPWDWRPADAASVLEDLKRSPNHVLLYSQNNIQLFGRVPGPPIAHTLEADFGGLIKLLGYTLKAEKVKAGDNLQLTLYWQALAKMDTSYHVFTHLTDENDRILSQRDNLPVNDTYPTTKWRVGEIIIDGYEIWVQPDTPPGRHLIETGLYELTTGQRLPVLGGAAGTPQDNRVILGEVRVVGE